MDLLPRNPHTYGSFVAENRCNCDESELFSIEIRRIECDFMDRNVKRLANVDRVAAGVVSASLGAIPVVGPFLALGAVAAQAPTWDQDLTHTALEVLFRCRSCRDEVHVTYEILGNGKVSNDFGRYTDTYERPLVLESGKNTSFVDIERAYRGMWTDYDFCKKNGKHWTDGFSNLIWSLP